MKVHLTVTGSQSDVLSLVGIAIESAILTEMHVAEDAAPIATWKRRPSKDVLAARFQPEARVVLHHSRVDRPELPPKGTTGVVLASRASGRGAAVDVQWDQNGNGIRPPATTVPSSLLRIVRR